MSIQIGTLIFESATSAPELMAEVVIQALSVLPNAQDVAIAAIDPGLSDTAAFCQFYKTEPKQAANCVIVEGKNGDQRQYAAVVLLANTRADINGVVRGFLQVKKVSFAQMEKAVEKSAMEFGAITPIGLPLDWPILVDAAVVQADYVIIGSGLRSSKLAVPGSFLATLPNVTVIDGLAHMREAPLSNLHV